LGYVGSARYGDADREQRIWYDFVPVDVNEVLNFHFTDTENATAPGKKLKIEGEFRPPSRLEQFMIMRDDLEKKGLI